MESPDRRPRLIIVCGLPGSGKTTHAIELERSLPGFRLSPDEWITDLGLDLYDERQRGKIEALQWKCAQKLLLLGTTIILEWGTWARSERDDLRLGARALGAAVELHYLSAPIDVLFGRIQNRGAEHPLIRHNDLVSWAKIFEVPTPEEFVLFDKPFTARP